MAHTLYFADGTTDRNSSTMRCQLEFSEKQTISECANGDKRYRIVSSYRLIAPGRYESEVIENIGFPASTGAQVSTEFRITDGKLFTTSYPPDFRNTTRVLVKIESEWVRVKESGAKTD